MTSTPERNEQISLPQGLTDAEHASPTVFVDTSGIDLQRADGRTLENVNAALFEALRSVCESPLSGEMSASGQTLLKVHVGEPKCVTRMRPEYVRAAVVFARERGASIVAGDTTVAYTGRRGHKDNPLGNARTYLELAHEQGWAVGRAAEVPFVVLDRPSTGVEGVFDFEDEEQRNEVDGIERFRDFYLAGGFAAADFVINYAHLTMHGLAGVAGCVKSLAMGCSSLRGKLRMHQALLPHFDAELCTVCGRCVDHCPENALSLPDGAPCPEVEPELCIGCGECVAICSLGKDAVRLRDEEVCDWERGESTLPVRMADYTLGLMNGHWARTVHVLHLYSVTSLCDCINHPQKPMLKRDLGFLVGWNPFAIDALAGRMLTEALRDDGHPVEEHTGLKTADQAAAHAKDAYGILPSTPVETVVVQKGTFT
ncbi:MAG: DUF362 domain-containing protein [Planctomycetota bacterium]